MKRLLLHTFSASPFFLAAVAGFGCVPPGNSTPSDAGPNGTGNASAAPTFRPSENVMRAPFEDLFERTAASVASAAASVQAPSGSASASASPATSPSASALGVAADSKKIPGARDGSSEGSSEALATPSASGSASATAPVRSGPSNASILGSDWKTAGTDAWRIENGRLCGQGAQNHGIWLNRTLPVNARIEFDAVSDGTDGDIKVEVWGDGRSAATSVSYTNATSYLAILGGWNNKLHVLARINEHGKDRREIQVVENADDPRQRAVVPGQLYHFKIERTDGKTIRWFIDDVEMFSWTDPQPLAGAGHDHFAFNNWKVKVCFDNVRVTPL